MSSTSEIIPIGDDPEGIEFDPDAGLKIFPQQPNFNIAGRASVFLVVFNHFRRGHGVVVPPESWCHREIQA